MRCELKQRREGGKMKIIIDIKEDATLFRIDKLGKSLDILKRDIFPDVLADIHKEG